MTTKQQAVPKVVSREERRVARESLLAKEKAATRARDALNAERRRLPMVKIATSSMARRARRACSTCSRDAASSSSTTSCIMQMRTDSVMAVQWSWRKINVAHS